jgi:hypothetical protein
MLMRKLNAEVLAWHGEVLGVSCKRRVARGASQSVLNWELVGLGVPAYLLLRTYLMC